MKIPTVALLLAAGLALADPTRLSAQFPPEVAVEEQRTAITKLAAMIGQWQGTGWIETPQGRSHFHGSELVELKLHGIALLVQGAFFYRDADTGEERPTHTTLAVITFDPQTKTYRFRSWLATGTSGERELQLTDDGWQWNLQSSRGTIRYITRFVGDQWIEIGEMSADGEAWRQFFAMTLTKVPAAGT